MYPEHTIDWRNWPAVIGEAREALGFTPELDFTTSITDALSLFGLDIDDPRHLDMIIRATTQLKEGFLQAQGTRLSYLIGADDLGLMTSFLEMAWAQVMLLLDDFVEALAAKGAVSAPQAYPEAEAETFRWVKIMPYPVYHVHYLTRQKHALARLSKDEIAEHDDSIGITRGLQAGRPLFAFTRMVSWLLLSHMIFTLIEVRGQLLHIPAEHLAYTRAAAGRFTTVAHSLLYICLPAKYKRFAESH